MLLSLNRGGVLRIRLRTKILVLLARILLSCIDYCCILYKYAMNNDDVCANYSSLSSYSETSESGSSLARTPPHRADSFAAPD